MLVMLPPNHAISKSGEIHRSNKHGLLIPICTANKDKYPAQCTCTVMTLYTCIKFFLKQEEDNESRYHEAITKLLFMNLYNAGQQTGCDNGDRHATKADSQWLSPNTGQQTESDNGDGHTTRTDSQWLNPNEVGLIFFPDLFIPLQQRWRGLIESITSIGSRVKNLRRG